MGTVLLTLLASVMIDCTLPDHSACGTHVSYQKENCYGVSFFMSIIQSCPTMCEICPYADPTYSAPTTSTTTTPTTTTTTPTTTTTTPTTTTTTPTTTTTTPTTTTTTPTTTTTTPTTTTTTPTNTTTTPTTTTTTPTTTTTTPTTTTTHIVPTTPTTSTIITVPTTTTKKPQDNSDGSASINLTSPSLLVILTLFWQVHLLYVYFG